MDRSELQTLLAQSRERLLPFLHARGLARGEAEDCIQEMWLRIGRAKLPEIKDPLSYLYRMADNMVIDLRRMAKRRSERETAWAGSTRDLVHDVDPSPSAEQTMLARERLAAFQAAIDGLPGRTAQIFRRFRLEGASQKEIASELGVTVSAVEKQLQRAYKTIIASLEALPPD